MLTEYLEQKEGLIVNAEYNKIKNFKNQEVLVRLPDEKEEKWELVHTKKIYGKNISSRNVEEVAAQVMKRLKELKLC